MLVDFSIPDSVYGILCPFHLKNAPLLPRITRNTICQSRSCPNPPLRNLKACMDCCSRCSLRYDLPERLLEEVLVEPRRQVKVRRWFLLVFESALHAIVKDRLWWLQQVVGRLVEGRSCCKEVVALGTFHVGCSVVAVGIGCNTRLGFGNLDHISLCLVCSEATVDCQYVPTPARTQNVHDGIPGVPGPY